MSLHRRHPTRNPVRRLPMLAVELPPCRPPSTLLPRLQTRRLSLPVFHRLSLPGLHRRPAGSWRRQEATE